LESGEDYLTSAVIDTLHGFAYFGTNTSPGKVIKVDLVRFTRVTALPLEIGDDRVSSAVIDPATGFAYFGTNTDPARIVKVSLSDFTHTNATRILRPGDGGLTSAVVFYGSQYAYFGTNSSPGKVVRVKIAPGNFTIDTTLNLSQGENQLVSAVIDADQFVYFGTGTRPGMVVKVNINPLNFTRVEAIPLELGEDILTSAVITTPMNYTNPFAYSRPDRLAFFGTWTSPGKIVEVNVSPSNFTRAGVVTLNEGEDKLATAVIDIGQKGPAYFGTDGSLGKIIKIGMRPRQGVITTTTQAQSISTRITPTATQSRPSSVTEMPAASSFTRDAMSLLSNNIISLIIGIASTVIGGIILSRWQRTTKGTAKRKTKKVNRVP
jgi:hypothetical protein